MSSDGAGLLRQRPVLAEQAVDLAEVRLRHRLVALEVGLGDAAGAAARTPRRRGRSCRCPGHTRTTAPAACVESSRREPMVEPRLDQDARRRVVTGWAYGSRPAASVAYSAPSARGGTPAARRASPPASTSLARREHAILLFRRMDDTRRHAAPGRRRRTGGPRPSARARARRGASPRCRRRRRPSRLAGHLPHGLLAPLVGGDRLARAGLRVEAREVEDPVLQRADAGRHRGPDQRRQRRHERAEHDRSGPRAPAARAPASPRAPCSRRGAASPRRRGRRRSPGWEKARARPRCTPIATAAQQTASPRSRTTHRSEARRVSDPASAGFFFDAAAMSRNQPPARASR